MINLNYDLDDIADPVFFGHVTEPNQRHTKGLARYLTLSKQTKLIDDPKVRRLLVSGVFDEHCYSINMMIPTLVNRVHWIPLDFSWRHFDGDFLTNRFLKQQGVNLPFDTIQRQNVATPASRQLYDKINAAKSEYDSDYQHLVKNFLELDIKLHVYAVDLYNHTNLDEE